MKTADGNSFRAWLRVRADHSLTTHDGFITAVPDRFLQVDRESSMPYTYHILPDEGYIYVSAEGRVTGEEILEATIALMQDPAWIDRLGQVVDMTGLTSLIVLLDDIKAILDLEKKHFKKLEGGRQAFVVRNELHEQLCKLYVAMSKFRKHPQESRVFRLKEEAVSWVIQNRP